MEIEGYEETFVHRAMILAVQFGADDVRIELPQGVCEDVFPRSANRPHRSFIDVPVTPISVEENVGIGHTVKDRLDARQDLP
jgi:hypothetical protein